MIALHKNGEALPVLTPVTSGSIIVDGTSAHAESDPIPEGVYRVAVESSVDYGGVHLILVPLGTVTVATVNTGMFIAEGSSEDMAIPEGMHISVINGKINITQFN